MDETTQTPPTPGPGEGTPEARGATPERRRRRIRVVRALLVTLVLAGAGLLVLTRTTALRPFVEGRLERMLGCDVEMGRVVVEPNGRLVAHNVRVGLPGVAGPAGQVLRTRRLVAQLDWDALFDGRIALHEVTLVRPLVRISQDIDTGRINVQEHPGTTTLGSAPAAGSLPRIVLLDALLELGEHQGANHRGLVRLPVAGRAEPRAENPLVYDITLSERPPDQSSAPSAAPVLLSGYVDARTVAGSLALYNLDLQRWGDRAAPANIRGAWQDLNVRGVVRTTEFTFSGQESMSASFTLEGVSMTLPLDAEPQVGLESPPPDEGRMEMRDVSGVVTVDRNGLRASGLRGAIGDLRYIVSFDIRGLDVNAPFTMTFTTDGSFSVGESPELLPFAPDIVRRRFRSFSGPTALIDAEVTVTRGDPVGGDAAEPSITGRLRFRDGAAAYESFRYPITQMSGHVEFDDAAIRLVSIVGVGPTGAKLFADGVISPPREGAQVDIDVTIVDVPLDEVFRNALAEQRRPIYDSLFDAEALARLESSGLVQSPEAHAQAQRDLVTARARAEAAPDDELAQDAAAEAEHAASIPGFALGGVADLRVMVHRDEGPDSEFTRTITLLSEEAGLIVEAFPYPVIARGLDVRVDQEVATVSIAALEGLSGAAGSMDAEIRLTRDDLPVFEPQIRVNAASAPIDELLLQAVPGSGDPDALDAPSVLRALGLRGDASCVATIVSRAGARIGYDIGVAFEGVSADLGDPTGAPLVQGLVGSLRASERGVEIDSLRGVMGDGAFEAAGSVVRREDGAPATVRASIDAARIDLSLPLERIAGAFSPDAARRLGEVREAHRPAGVVDGGLEVSTEGGALAYRAELVRSEGLEFDAFGGRLGLAQRAGAVTVTDAAATFDGFEAAATFGGEPIGDITVNGEFSMVEGGEGRATLEVEGARFERPIVRSIVGGSEGGAAALESFAPVGAFDAELTLIQRGEAISRVEGVVRPTDLTLNVGAERVVFHRASGDAHFVWDRDGRPALSGRAEGVALECDALGLRIDGPWLIGADGRPEVDLTLSARAPHDSGVMRAFLPPAARRTLDEIEFRCDGPISLEPASLRGALGKGDGAQPWTFDGVVRLDGASLDAGLPVSEARGDLEIRARGLPDGDARVDLSLAAESLRMAGLRMEHARGRVVAEGGTALVPVFEADAHRGRVSIDGRVWPDAEQPDRRRFEGAVRAAGLDFALCARDLASALGEQESTPDAPPPEPGERGVLDASISLEGVVGSPASRTGRGEVVVRDGAVVKMPLLLQLIELSNLTLPFGGRIDSARAAFFVEGGTVRFEDLRAVSNSVELVGAGTMGWPSLDLDLRVTSRARNRLVLISDLLEGVRDEIATITIQGTLGAPKFGSETLSGTRRLLDSILTAGSDEPDRSVVRPSKPTPPRDAAAPDQPSSLATPRADPSTSE